ncbi:unnamed protein product [Fraxinus pennsylvanica]|uniref:Uncharacterized protein n=1 Tax=Fraxinus pennsylvanica TaxID=56036 RepID=A0AAD1YXC1_9LAMI|nr:unnamed protein product [Fraxinus pennsylvanica]
MSASFSSLQGQRMSKNLASNFVLSKEAEEQLNTHVIQAGKAIFELSYTNEELLQELDAVLNSFDLAWLIWKTEGKCTEFECTMLEQLDGHMLEVQKKFEDLAKETEAGNMDDVEKEASEFLKMSKAKLQETIMQIEGEVQMCAQELFSLIDSASTYKEYMGSKISKISYFFCCKSVSLA